MAIIGSIAISLGLNAAKFQEELKRSRTALDKFAKKVNKTFRSFKKSIGNAISSVFSFKSALVLLAGAGGLALVASASLKVIDNIGKLSKTYGIATEELSSFRVAADLGGTSLETFAKAARRVSTNVYDFVVRDTGLAKDAFAQLGISVSDLTPIINDSAAVMGLIGDKLNQLEDGNIKTALAAQLFGGRATELLPALAGGAEQMRKYREQADLFGLTLNASAVKGVENANDAMTKLRYIVEGLVTQMTAALAPSLQKAVDTFRDWILETAKARGGIKNLAKDFAIQILNGIRTALLGVDEFINGLSQVKQFLVEIGVINDEIGTPVARLREEIEKVNKELARGAGFSHTAREQAALLEKRRGLQATLNGMLADQAKLDAQNIGLVSQGVEAIDKMTAAIERQQQVKADAQETKKTTTSAGVGISIAEVDTIKQQMADVQTYVDNARSTDLQKLENVYENRLFIIETAFQNEIISETRKNAIILGLTAEFENDKTKIAEAEEQKRQANRQLAFSSAASLMNSLAAINGNANKKQFEENKKYARSAVLIDTAGGIMKAFNSGLPYPVAVLAAASVALKGAASLATINRSTFGGGGSISAGGTGGGYSPSPTTSPLTQQQSPQNNAATTEGRNITVNMNMNGNWIANQDMKEYFKEVFTDLVDSDHINITVLGEKARVTT
ncbi:MAG: hypothetical protein OEZ68_12035, partial [Gammaproteobacteria bacterium]|nr:hypothetical protein [Gammaproteobacteria bacterium]